MRVLFRLAFLASFAFAPAIATAQFLGSPDLTEDEARVIAFEHGVTNIDSAHVTFGGDWEIEGTDDLGRRIELEIDGTTGQLEHAELHAN